MESFNDIKQALSARSRTATLDQLRNEGHKRVRLIRAEHIAQMVSEAVNSAVENSGRFDQNEVDQLIEKSRKEFQSILRERESEIHKAREIEDLLEQKDQEIRDLKARFSEVINATRAELAQTNSDLESMRAMSAPSNVTEEVVAQQSDAMTLLAKEFADLKATMAQQQQVGQQSQPAKEAPDFSAAIEEMTSSLTDRIETLGKKMGVSAAVEGDAPVDLGGLFKGADGETLESNMENINVKQQAAGGIAANLAKLKKLKGGD